MAENSDTSTEKSVLDKIMEEMTQMKEKLESLEEGLQTPKRPKKTVIIPEDVRAACRTVIKKLREDKTISLNFDSFQNNTDAIERIVGEVKRLYNDRRWGEGTINEACKSIWRNLRDQNTRIVSGKYEKHRKDSKDKKRLRVKLKRRQSALENLDATDKEKEEIKLVLKPEFMSPEKSDDESGGRKRIRIPFKWESSLLTRRKEKLDQAYEARLSPSARRQLAIVEDARDNSTTDSPPPKETPSWAISRKYKQ